MMTHEEALKYYDKVDECITKISNAQSRVYDQTRSLEEKDALSTYLYTIICELNDVKEYFENQVDIDKL